MVCFVPCGMLPHWTPRADPTAVLMENEMATTAVQTEVERAPRMSAFELSRTQEFSHLSAKMGRFVLAYVQTLLDSDTADPLAAVKYAYNCKNDESARTFGFQLLSNIKIVLTLNRFFGVSPSEAFLKQIEKAIYNPNLSVAAVDALKMHCDANGIQRSGVGIVSKVASDKNHGHKATEPKPATATAQRFSVGDFCYQDGKKFRITSVDTTGHPLTAVAVEGEVL
jgi:hypothetical protein